MGYPSGLMTPMVDDIVFAPYLTGWSLDTGGIAGFNLQLKAELFNTTEFAVIFSIDDTTIAITAAYTVLIIDKNLISDKSYVDLDYITL